MTTLTMDPSTTIPGSYRLCMRLLPGESYQDHGPFTVFSIGSVVPDALPVVSGGSVTTQINGSFLPNPSSVVITSAADCSGTPPPSAVTSTTVTFLNVSTWTVTIDDHAATSGVYRVCVQSSPTSSYHDAGQTITLGTFLLTMLLSSHVLAH